METHVVYANDVDEQYGCYIDSVWTDVVDANARRDALNEQDEYSYDEPWSVEHYSANTPGAY